MDGAERSDLAAKLVLGCQAGGGSERRRQLFRWWRDLHGDPVISTRSTMVWHNSQMTTIRPVPSLRAALGRKFLKQKVQANSSIISTSRPSPRQRSILVVQLLLSIGNSTG